MNNDEVLQVFRDAGALLEGHFILSSGRRSPVFLQKALVFSQPELSAKLCSALAAKVKDRFGEIDIVVGPAMGGLFQAMNWHVTSDAERFSLNVSTVNSNFVEVSKLQRANACLSLRTS